MYREGIEAGIEPGLFWTYTIAEITAIIRRIEVQDRLAWMRTAHLLNQTANMNRGKGVPPYTWDQFTPYGREDQGPPPVRKPTEAHLTKALQMGAAMTGQHG